MSLAVMVFLGPDMWQFWVFLPRSAIVLNMVLLGVVVVKCLLLLGN